MSKPHLPTCILKWILWPFTAFLSMSFISHAAEDGYDPKASEEAVVVYGNARFTVLTDRLVRMEWSADGQFEDRATFAVVNRRLPVPEFKVTRTSGKLTIKTGGLTLTYRGSGKFDSDNWTLDG